MTDISEIIKGAAKIATEVSVAGFTGDAHYASLAVATIVSGKTYAGIIGKHLPDKYAAEIAIRILDELALAQFGQMFDGSIDEFDSYLSGGSSFYVAIMYIAKQFELIQLTNN